jgi:hypothetical protein
MTERNGQLDLPEAFTVQHDVEQSDARQKNASLSAGTDFRTPYVKGPNLGERTFDWISHAASFVVKFAKEYAHH